MARRFGPLIIIVCVCEIVVSFRIHTGNKPEDLEQSLQADVSKHKQVPSAKISSTEDVGAELSRLTDLESKPSLASVFVPSPDVDPVAVSSINQSSADGPTVSSPGGQAIEGYEVFHEVVPSAAVQLAHGVALPQIEHSRDNATGAAVSGNMLPTIAEEVVPRHTILPSVGVLVIGASLLEQRVVAWISSTAATKVKVGSRQLSFGSGLRWAFGVLLIGLVFFCAAARCLNSRHAEQPAYKRAVSRSLEKPTMQKGVTFSSQKTARFDDVLREVASPRLPVDAEEQTPTSFISFGRALTSPRLPAAALTEAIQQQRSQTLAIDSVAAIVAIAKRMDRTVMKYPKGGRGWFVGSAAQSRYIRMQRYPDMAGKKKTEQKESREKNAEHELSLWRQGRLGWWESKAAYDKQDKPKGAVLLPKVHSVSIGSDKTIVEIQHQDQQSKKILEFVFPSSAEAKAWCEAFLDLLAQLHEDVAEDKTCIAESSAL